MAKSTGLEKVRIFPRKTMGKVANLYETVFRKRVKRGMDAKGGEFEPYTSEYAKKKGRGFTKIRGKGRYAGIKVVASTRTSPPDLIQSGLTMKSFKRLRFGKFYFAMGWDKRGEIIQGQKNQGRDIISDVPKKEKFWIAKKLKRELDLELKRKIKDVRVVVRT